MISGYPYELTMGMPARRIKVGDRERLILADKEHREIQIDGNCYYRLGETPTDLSKCPLNRAM